MPFANQGEFVALLCPLRVRCSREEMGNKRRAAAKTPFVGLARLSTAPGGGAI